MDDTGGFERSDWLKSAGGVLFFAAGLLTWWELEFEAGLPFTTNAFDYNLTGKVPYAIFVLMAIFTILIKTESLGLPQVFVHPGLSLVAALIGTVLVGIRFFDDGYDNAALPDDYSVTRGIGLYLAALAALIVLAGCVLGYRDVRAERQEDVDEPDATPSAIEREPTRRRASPPLP